MSSSSRRAKDNDPSSSATHSFFTGSALSSSRPFLNMINPIGRQYQGYIRADAPLDEEDEEQQRSGGDESEEDVERGSTAARSPTTPSAKSQGKRRAGVASHSGWDGDSSEMNVLRPNIHKQDSQHEREESSGDDEVPQDFMIEAKRPTATARSSKHLGKSKIRKTSSTATAVPPGVTASRSTSTGRGQPLYSVAGKSAPPLLPTVAPHISQPPKPSDYGYDGRSSTPRSVPRAPSSVGGASSDGARQGKTMRGLDEYEKALWNWVNVYNLDAFLQEVYSYYEGNGIYSIALSRGLNLLTVGFVIGFSTFLIGCIDYSKFRIQKVHRLSDAVIDRCVSKFSGFTLLFFMLFTAFYVWQIVSYVLSVMRLVDMYNFYTHLLKIPDTDIQTISWSEVVRRIGAIREENPITAISSGKSKSKDNNIPQPNLMHTTLPTASFGRRTTSLLFSIKSWWTCGRPSRVSSVGFATPEKSKGKVLTQALEWNLRFCLMEYLFDDRGKVRKVFLKSKNRAALVEGLRRRFIFMGILNAAFAPFIVMYFTIYSFFRYFEQYHKDPSSIGGRRYTLYAQWKFREFNELPHIFTRRLDESYPIASMYINQFPNGRLTILMRFVAFIAGSFAAVLVLATLVDPDLEVTPHRTVFFYLGVFGGILTVARGSIPEENRVFDPELLMTEVITYTHYMPEEWKGQLHSKKVHEEFGELFAMRVMIFLKEIVSVVLTPFVLWFSLPECAPAIVDFFREFTVHVDGRGYVCSFAEFNFERHGNVKFGAPAKAQDKRMISNEGKMEKSFLNFKAANPDWNPSDLSGSLYLNRMADLTANLHHTLSSRRRQQTQNMQQDLSATVHFAPDPAFSTSRLDRSHDYDRALKQSQHAALTRRRGMGMGMAGSMMTMSMLGGGVGASVYAGGASLANTAVLATAATAGGARAYAGRGLKLYLEMGPSASVMSDEAGLGDSYVDGAKRQVQPFVAEDHDEDEERLLEDGGVLGLLAQIYGRRDGQGGVGIS
ncbi:putative transmembrane protein [Ephemerocybe angulata]|uniref:Autophagy-related protein 9 n=1 Tax=Ephemerocybe angulata TaxID=980116 RepID=A0A8H6MFH4_9AGAR|nr:putative transmembrane protein [Tulosesus angulatus]